MLGYYEIKTNSSSIWKIITAVGITVAGALCFLIPKVGWIIGGTIVGAGITGLMAAAKNSNITCETSQKKSELVPLLEQQLEEL